MCFLISRVKACRVLFIVILFCVVIFMYTYYNHRLITLKSETNTLNSLKSEKKGISYLNNEGLKHILLWTDKKGLPLSTIGPGKSSFVKGKCKYTNCFVTDNKGYLNDLREFNVVVFGGLDVMNLSPFQLPSKRSPKQKYIFAASEPADYYPVCSPMFNDFFNWTWTYKVDSNIFWGYFNIYDVNNNIIGPSLNMEWLDTLDPIDEEVKVKLSKKSKTAAWFVSHCTTNGGREGYVEELQKELKPYGRNVDIYGHCGNFTCPRRSDASCFKKIERDYYFYLSFENSFSEDYVTEKLLSALNNYAVPVVYGSANYSRFLPPGSYLHALDLGPKELARQMDDIINDKSKYHDFFRWRNHYKYRFTEPLDEICKLCKVLNDEEKVSQVTIWSDFRTWWNGESLDKC